MSPPDLATFRSINSRVAIVVGLAVEWSRHPISNLETPVQIPDLTTFLLISLVVFISVPI